MFDKVFSKTSFLLFLFIGICLLGAALRFHSLSSFKIYPDSYQSLLVAQNILTYHSVVGFLGPHGMLYPDFISWTRPGYPLLMVFGTFFSSDMTQVAQIISFTLGVLAIPLVFLLTKTLFHSVAAGFCGAFLTAISFYHTVWSGFIMTETVGVFFLLLFLLHFFITLHTKKANFLFTNIVNGVLLAFTVLTRYEYLVLVFPLIIFLFLANEHPFKRLSLMFVSFSVVIIFIGVQFFPLESLDKIIIEQLKDFWPFALTGLLLLPIIIYIVKRNITKIIIGMIIIMGIIASISFFTEIFLALRSFILHELLLVTCFIVGLFLLRQKNQPLVFFILLAIFTLGLVYYRVNETMDRYFTHLLPFLLIPASLGFKEIIFIKKVNKRKLLIITLFIILILIQLLVTYHGLRYLNDPSWFRISYEEKSAALLKGKLNNQQILITSQPEPYFYRTHVSTQSLIDRYPFVLLTNLPKQQAIIIVEDMGMHTYFPNFTQFLSKNMKKNKIAAYYVGENYHREHLSSKENSQIILYKTTVRELQTKIRQNQDN